MKIDSNILDIKQQTFMVGKYDSKILKKLGDREMNFLETTFNHPKKV